MSNKISRFMTRNSTYKYEKKKQSENTYWEKRTVTELVNQDKVKIMSVIE